MSELKIRRGKISRAQKIVFYGPEGIGKTTIASKFPNPLFIDTEGGSYHLDVARFEEVPQTWEKLLEQVQYVKKNTDVCQSLIVDTADWAEALCKTYVCNQKMWTSIAEPGYGAGYVALEVEFGKLLNLLSGLQQAGINVIVLAHSQMRKFEQPDEAGSYDRYELKLEKKTSSKLKEWADALIFLNYQTFITGKDKTGKGKATGGKRMMYLNHRPTFDAKNRWNLNEEEYPLSYEILENEIQVWSNQEEAQKKKETSSQKGKGKPESTIHPKLLSLMKKDNVTLSEVMNAVYFRGYASFGTPYEELDNEFVTSVLIEAWNNGVLQTILDLRNKEKVEF